MRYLILSDIHSNDEALAAVLARVRRKRFDRVVILRDFVGYGSNPNQVLDRIRRIRREKVSIRGNHDKVVCGLEAGEQFNPIALAAARWTAEKLTPQNRKFLEALPVGPLEVEEAFAICHGSPRDEDAYIFSDRDAWMNFRDFGFAVCFFGHSHIPSVFTLEPHGIQVDVVKGDRVRMQLDPETFDIGDEQRRRPWTEGSRSRSAGLCATQAEEGVLDIKLAKGELADIDGR